MTVDAEQAGMIRELVARFVDREMIPLEPEMLRRLTRGERVLTDAEIAHLDMTSKELGLWGLDAPADMGGSDLPSSVMLGVWEELGRTIIPYAFPPDSPNLRMMQAVGSDAQKARYLQPYVEGKISSAMGISEPGAGGDPAAMTTRAVRDGDEWVINGRKIWISNVAKSAFTIVMARVGEDAREGGITAFIVEHDRPGFIVEREIPMLAGLSTYELVLDNCRVPADAVLGEIGKGYGPMQLRLQTRRLEIGARAVAVTRRAIGMLIDHARERVTFGAPLSDRQAIQWWIADASIQLHACQLMLTDAAAKVDRGEDARNEISMIKVYATEMAYQAVDNAMQTLGALGMTRETVLHQMWQAVRLTRIYEGPSEVHRQAIARRAIKNGGI